MYALIDGDIPTYSLCYDLEYGQERELEDRVDNFVNTIMRETKAEDYKIFLTSKSGCDIKDNFRYDHLPEYKGGRASSKPVLHQYARDYMQMEHLAVMSSPRLEADDMIAIEHTEHWNRDMNPSVIASIDKDFYQLQGWHYKWEVRTGKRIIPSRMFEINSTEGNRNLYHQALTGDKVDNIEGVRGIGEKKAKKILEGAESEKEMYERVLHAYNNVLGEEGKDAFHKNMNCLYLIRQRKVRTGEPIFWRKP